MSRCLWNMAALGGALLLSQTALAGGSLADAYATIASKQFVDLTHAFSPETPVWKGFGQATQDSFAIYIKRLKK